MEKDFQDRINDAFENINLPDKGKLWDKIDAELDKSNDKKAIIWFRKNYVYGFVILCLVSIGYGLYYHSSATNKNQSPAFNKMTETKSDKQDKNNDLYTSSVPRKDKGPTGNPEKSLKSEEAERIEPIEKSLAKTNHDLKTKKENTMNPAHVLPENDKPADSNHEGALTGIGNPAKTGSNIEDDKVEETLSVKIAENKDDSLKPPVDSTSSDTVKTRGKIRFGFNIGIAVNNYTVTNPSANPLNLLTIGLQAKYQVKDHVYFKSLLNFSNEAMDIEYYDYPDNDYKADKIQGCRNFQLAALAGKQIGRWGVETGLYFGYTFGLYGTTVHYRDIQSGSELKMEGRDLVSTHKLDKDLITASYFRNFDYGLQFGFNYQFNKINLGCRYAQGLRDFIHYENYYKGHNTFNPHRNLLITIGYQFNK